MSPNAGYPITFRRFGSTDLRVSEIGLGTSALAGRLVRRDLQGASTTLLKAFDYGINFFDTSASYGQGECERIIGRAFKGRRDRVVIATIGGLDYMRLGRATLRLKRYLTPIRGVLRPMRDARPDETLTKATRLLR